MSKGKKHEGRPNHNNQGGGQEWVREWAEDKVFRTDDGKMGLVLQKSNDRFPLFRWELAEFSPDGKKYSRMKVVCAGRRTGTISVPNIAGDVAKLFEAAGEYVQGVLQVAEDQFIERDQQRGQHQEKAPTGIKSWGKRDRERRERHSES